MEWLAADDSSQDGRLTLTSCRLAVCRSELMTEESYRSQGTQGAAIVSLTLLAANGG